MTKPKKSQIWVSAVLYIALSMVVLTLILSAGVPLINKMRDRNTFTQTKNLFFSLDDNIRAVANEGPGSKRFLSPLDIRKGEFSLDEADNLVKWKMRTNYNFMEVGIRLREGVVVSYLEETNIVGENDLNLELNYTGIAILNLKSDYSSPFTGRYSMAIIHDGTYINNLPVIIIEIT